MAPKSTTRPIPAISASNRVSFIAVSMAHRPAAAALLYASLPRSPLIPRRGASHRRERLLLVDGLIVRVKPIPSVRHRTEVRSSLKDAAPHARDAVRASGPIVKLMEGLTRTG